MVRFCIIVMSFSCLDEWRSTEAFMMFELRQGVFFAHKKITRKS